MKNIQINNIENEKLEIINWIININDEKLLKKISSLKEKNAKTNVSLDQQKENIEKTNIRKFGFGKGTFTYISEDFDEELEEF